VEPVVSARQPRAPIDVPGVDLTDLSGFIGGEPVRANTAKAAPQQRDKAAQANASDKLLPDKPISVSRLDWADIHLRYRGDISRAAICRSMISRSRWTS
jgi:hypothetical protein